MNTKMKDIRTKITITLAVVAGMTLGSCSEDFLDVASRTEPNSQNYYKTESQAQRALHGCYDGWRQVSSNPGPFGFLIASSIMSDECFGGAGMGDGYNAQLVDRFDKAASPSDMNVYEQEWKVYYAGVFRCNTLIAAEKDITWKSEADYPDWLGKVDPSLYAVFSLTIDSSDNTARFVLPDGTVVNTTFTLDDKGIFTFEGKVPAFTVIGWANFNLDANNALRVMTIEKDEKGKVTGMWLGAKAVDKDEYMAYHMIIKH